jgi:translation initiation factor 3 subunit M
MIWPHRHPAPAATPYNKQTHNHTQQVQPWVVRAIGSKLLEARIDQVAATVVISRCHHRTFTSREWQGLGQQLAALRGALGAATDMLVAKQGGARGGGAPAAAAGGRPGATQAVH